MDLISLGLGLLAGFFLGAGALLFYMRWKMTKQLNAMQQDMQGMFDMTEDLMGEVDEIEEVEEEKGKDN